MGTTPSTAQLIFQSTTRVPEWDRLMGTVRRSWVGFPGEAGRLRRLTAAELTIASKLRRGA